MKRSYRLTINCDMHATSGMWPRHLNESGWPMNMPTLWKYGKNTGDKLRIYFAWPIAIVLTLVLPIDKDVLLVFGQKTFCISQLLHVSYWVAWHQFITRLYFDFSTTWSSFCSNYNANIQWSIIFLHSNHFIWHCKLESICTCMWYALWLSRHRTGFAL